VWVKRVGKDVVAFIKINPRVRRAVFGEKGKNLERALKILKRHTKITKIKVIVENPRFKRRGTRKLISKEQQQEQVEKQPEAQQDVKETANE
jgi:N utilization substance protein A